MNKLKDTVVIFFEKKILHVLESSSNTYVSILVDKPYRDIEECFLLLKKGLLDKQNKENEELLLVLLKNIPKNYFVENSPASTHINESMERNYIKIESLVGDAVWAKSVMENIKNMKVAVLGIGSLGCHIIQHLLCLGHQQLALIDYDIIEPSNLNRQILFSHNDVGKYKIDVAKKYIQNFNSDIRVDTFHSKIGNVSELSEILRSFNTYFFFLTADKPVGKITSICAESAKHVGCSWVRVNRNGYGPFWFASSSCSNCHYLFARERVRKYDTPNHSSVNLSLGVFNHDVSLRVSLLMKDYIAFILNQDSVKDKHCHINSSSQGSPPIIEYEPTRKHRNCPCHN